MIEKNLLRLCKNKSFDFGENRTQVQSFKDKYHNHYTKQPCDVTLQKNFFIKAWKIRIPCPYFILCQA